MNIEVRLFATLREGRWKKKVLNYEEDLTVERVLEDINIKKEDIAILLINGRDGKTNTTLNDGDVLSMFPPVGGG